MNIVTVTQELRRQSVGQLQDLRDFFHLDLLGGLFSSTLAAEFLSSAIIHKHTRMEVRLWTTASLNKYTRLSRRYPLAGLSVFLGRA